MSFAVDLGLPSTSQELSIEGSQPPGLWAARWGGSVAGSSGHPAKQQEAQLGETALGAGPGGRKQRSRCGKGGGWDLILVPLRAGPTANSAPTAGPSCSGILEQGDSKLGLAEGRLCIRGPCRKFLKPSCSAQKARPQMFLR